MRIKHPPMSQFISLGASKNLLEKANGVHGGGWEVGGDGLALEKESFGSGLSRLVFSCPQTSMPVSHSLLLFFFSCLSGRTWKFRSVRISGRK